MTLAECAECHGGCCDGQDFEWDDDLPPASPHWVIALFAPDEPGTRCARCGVDGGVFATIKPHEDLREFIDPTAVYCTHCRQIILGRLFYRQPGNDVPPWR